MAAHSLRGTAAWGPGRAAWVSPALGGPGVPETPQAARPCRSPQVRWHLTALGGQRGRTGATGLGPALKMPSSPGPEGLWGERHVAKGGDLVSASGVCDYDCEESRTVLGFRVLIHKLGMSPQSGPGQAFSGQGPLLIRYVPRPLAVYFGCSSAYGPLDWEKPTAGRGCGKRGSGQLPSPPGPDVVRCCPPPHVFLNSGGHPPIAWRSTCCPALL